MSGNDTPAEPADDNWRCLAHRLTVGQRRRLFWLELEGLADREELLRVARQWAHRE